MNEENGLVDTVGQGVSGMNGEISINIYTLLCVKQTVIEKLLNSTGSPVWHSVMGWGEGKEAQEGGDVCIIMAHSHCCLNYNTL